MFDNGRYYLFRGLSVIETRERKKISAPVFSFQNLIFILENRNSFFVAEQCQKQGGLVKACRNSDGDGKDV